MIFFSPCNIFSLITYVEDSKDRFLELCPVCIIVASFVLRFLR